MELSADVPAGVDMSAGVSVPAGVDAALRGALRAACWRKSSRSGGNGGSCVEVADNLAGIIGVRDSKDRGGPVLTFTPSAWRAFVTDVTRPR